MHLLSNSPSLRRLRVACWALAILVQIAVLAVPAGAHAAGSWRTLFLTGRFNQLSAPGSQPLARQVLAQPGETEGFQIITKLPVVDGVFAPTLKAQVASSSDPWIASHASLFRVGFVRVTRASTAVGKRGQYADPIPPLPAGGFPVSQGNWAGVVVSITVPQSEVAATYSGAIELFADNSITPYATIPFTVRISSVAAISQESGNAFHALVGVRPTYYRAAAPTANTAAQFQNLFSFLADHKVTPLDWTYSKPNRYGAYTVAAAAALQGYQSLPFATKLIPNNTTRFKMQENFGTHGQGFLAAIWNYWQTKGWTSGPAYLYSWDEPSGKDEHTRLPALMRLLHATTPNIKGFVTTTPRQKIKPRRYCRKWHKPKCFLVPGSSYSNRNLWDGGSDDPDVFVVAAQRFYGLVTNRIERRLKIDHTFDVWKRIRKLHRQNKQVWSYTYYVPTKHIPQLVIDGVGTDPRLLFWWNAKAGNTGWLTWEIARWINPQYPASSAVPRNPYTNTVSFITPNGGKANGDTSLIYPPISTMYGLNDPTAAPVSSLRFEALRDGIEDANLLAQYRVRFGERALQQLMTNVFGRVRRARDGNYTWPTYTNRGMGVKLEVLRRQVILALEVAP